MFKVVSGLAKSFEIIMRAGLAIACSLVVFVNTSRASDCAQLYPAPPGEEFRLKSDFIYLKGVTENGQSGIRAMIKDDLENMNVAGVNTDTKTLAHIAAVEFKASPDSSRRHLADIYQTPEKVVVILNYGRSQEDSFYAIYKNNQLSCGKLPENAKELFLGQFKSAGYKINESVLKVENSESIAKSLGLVE